MPLLFDRKIKLEVNSAGQIQMFIPKKSVIDNSRSFKISKNSFYDNYEWKTGTKRMKIKTKTVWF